MLQYILKLSISLSVVYLFYQLLLRRLTFYNLNRWYLLGYSILCFVIPFVNVFTFFTEPALRNSAIVSYIPAIEELTKQNDAAAIPSFNWLQIITAVVITGMVAMIVRLVFQYYSLLKIRSKAVLLYNDKVKLYHIDKPVIPFSFGNAIFVNQHQHNEAELKEIIRHEFIHVKQRHSLDILWCELLCIVNWYNPFAWLLRKDIRQNLEFIADQQVLKTGLDRKQYQYLLLKVLGVNAFSIASNFNFSSLKKRIAMMNKTKSAKVHLIRFLFILPLLVVVLLAFRNTRQQQPAPVVRALVTDTVPFNLADVISMEVNNNDGHKIITLHLKNGQVEKYDFNNPKDQQAFKNKYGELPEPPQPPNPPALKIDVAPQPPQPPQQFSDTIVAPQNVESMDVNKEKSTITIKLKNGKVEKYDMRNPKEKEAFEKRYIKHEPPQAPEPPATPPVPSAAPAAAPAAAVSAKPVTTVTLKPVADVTPEPVTVKNSRVAAVAPVVVADVAPAPEHVVVKDEFQGVFNDPKHLPSEIVGIISKTDTEDQLKQLQKNIEAKGFKLEIDNTTYVNGILANVIGRISDGSENVAFSATDFQKILLIESLKDGKCAGFHIVIKSENQTAPVSGGHHPAS